MAEKIRAGMLGTAHAHAPGKLRVMKQSPDWELAGVCEPDGALRGRLERDEAWAGVRWLSEAELLEDPAVRMVAVEGDVPQLLSMGRRAIDAGKHIHLDKPAGSDLAAFRALLDAAARRHLLVQMGYMFRYNAGFDLVRRAVREGWLGEIHYLHGSINSAIPADSRRRLARYPGGMQFELACHLLDMLVLLMGRPARVTPFLRSDAPLKDGLADNTVAVLEFDRAIAVIESAAMEAGAFPRRHFEVCGSRGTIVLQPLEPPAVKLFLSEPREGYAAGWQEVTVENRPRYAADLAELARCIRGEQPFPYATDHDYAVQETVLRASGM